MRAASAATQAILEGGQWILAELIDVTLITGQMYHWTSFQVPLTALVTGQYGPYTYQTGLTIKRGTITQQAGTTAGTMKLTIAPQPDSPNAPVLVNGWPVIEAARLGLFDGATVQLSKLFMAAPAPGAQLDTSPGAVGWFRGLAQNVQAGRLAVEITVDDYIALLGAQQMPRQLWGVGCFHQLYDAGCTLLKANFTSTGSVTSATDGAHFGTGLTQADDYFDLGVITFTSGVNNGLSATVSTFKNSGGAIVTRLPFPKTPAVGDTFSIYPGCDLQQATCSGKFNNLAHFSGQPYIPVPETVLDGNAEQVPAQKPGAQAGQLIGAQPAGQAWYPGSYKY